MSCIRLCVCLLIKLLAFAGRLFRFSCERGCISFYGYFVCSSVHVYNMYAYMSNLVSVCLCVLTCMWKPWGVIHPRGVLSERCAAFAARLSRPCTQCSVAFLLMAFMGRSQAANEQPWHQNNETMTWNQAGVSVGAAWVREAGPWSCYKGNTSKVNYSLNICRTRLGTLQATWQASQWNTVFLPFIYVDMLVQPL